MTKFEVYELMTPSPEEKEIVSRIENDSVLGTFIQLSVHLGHFKYAMGQLKSTMISDKRYAFGFYSESILRRIGDWFAEPKNMPDSLIDQALRKVGLVDDVIKPLDQLLDSPIGQTTWRRFIKDYRNAASVHDIFDGDAQSKVCRKYGVSQEYLSNEIVSFLDSMDIFVEALQNHVEVAFYSHDPQVYKLLRRHGGFLSTGITI